MDADETRIITVFGAEEVPEVYKENLLKYWKYLLQHLDRKTILTGREDFPWVSIFRPKRMWELLFILSFRWGMLMRHAVLRAVAPLPLLLTLVALAASAPSWAQGTCDAGTSFTYSLSRATLRRLAAGGSCQARRPPISLHALQQAARPI